MSDRRPELPRRFAPLADAKDRPLWSVMIPTYNCAGYLRETLACVLAQDPGPDQMQIEVVDDCSTDDPQAIVDELAPDRVSFHRQPENRRPHPQLQHLHRTLTRPARPHPPRRRHRPRRLLPHHATTLPRPPRNRRRLLPLHLDGRRRRLGDDRRARAGRPRVLEAGSSGSLSASGCSRRPSSCAARCTRRSAASTRERA